MTYQMTPNNLMRQDLLGVNGAYEAQLLNNFQKKVTF